jgi:hypothetical protein
MPTKTEAWQCDFCKDVKITRDQAATHEKLCWENPKNKACYTCQYYDPYPQPRTLQDFDKKEARICYHPKRRWIPDEKPMRSCGYWVDKRRLRLIGWTDD